MRALFHLAMFAAFLWGVCAYFPVARAIVLAPITLAEGAASTVELHNLQKLVTIFYQREARFPSGEEFERMIQDNFQSNLKDPRLDTWRNPYLYRYDDRRFEIRSGGPDGRPYTDDDLVITWER